MPNYSEPIQQLIDHFAKLPGIGPKTAERLVYFLLYQNDNDLNSFAKSLSSLKRSLTRCNQCYNYTESNPCVICSNPQRSKTAICIVSKPQDLVAIEKSGDFDGKYHILGGVIDPLEGITPDKLNIAELVERIKNDNVTEIILGLNPDMPGETTMLYISKVVKDLGDIKITRLARGLPIGSDIEYADEVTLSNAIKGRKEV